MASWLTSAGWVPTRFGSKRQVGQNEFQVEYETAKQHGMAWYSVLPGPSGYVITMRTANTGPDAWQRRGGEASSVARSVTCKLP